MKNVLAWGNGVARALVKDYGYYTHVIEGGNLKLGFTEKMSTE